jgi:uncharacterized membrane protein
MEIDILNAGVALAGFFGFLVAGHIYRKKKMVAAGPFTCPLNFDCAKVVTSRFSRLAGVPFEIWGMAYYGFIVASYGVLIFFPNFKTEEFSYGVFTTSIFAFLVSLYLTFVQAFRIREWCSWCLLSALFSTIILAISFMNIFEKFVFLISF